MHAPRHRHIDRKTGRLRLLQRNIELIEAGYHNDRGLRGDLMNFGNDLKAKALIVAEFHIH